MVLLTDSGIKVPDLNTCVNRTFENTGQALSGLTVLFYSYILTSTSNIQAVLIRSIQTA